MREQRAEVGRREESVITTVEEPHALDRRVGQASREDTCSALLVELEAFEVARMHVAEDLLQELLVGHRNAGQRREHPQPAQQLQARLALPAVVVEREGIAGRPQERRDARVLGDERVDRRFIRLRIAEQGADDLGPTVREKVRARVQE
ncbi:hypothetical protein [Nannocystis pusilla]|uniref:hypothetical protein n=1 Tax=Nannocystis pusilla TaxID=889268 RepID=UPI003B805328